MKEHKTIRQRIEKKQSLDNFLAGPDPDNILHWYYLIFGLDGPYEGGYYMGRIEFTKEYPHKPPAIKMLTPNGRFQTNYRICLSISDYHPETWSPAWSISHVIIALISFMQDDEMTHGGIETTNEVKMSYASASLDASAKLPLFKEVFGDDLTLTGLSE